MDVQWFLVLGTLVSVIWTIIFGISVIFVAEASFFDIPAGDISDAMIWGAVVAIWSSWGWIVLVVGIIICYAVIAVIDVAMGVAS